MKLAAIILNFRTADMTVDAVKATIEALDQTDFDWCIKVVDNDSGDGSEERLRSACLNEQARKTPHWDKIEVIQSGRNGGFGAGNNVGIRQAMEQYPELEYVYILNSDAFPEKEALISLSDFLDSHKNYGIAGSAIYGVDGEPHTTAFRFPTIQSELEGSIKLGIITKLFKNYVVPMGMPEQSIDVDWLAGASMMMRTKTIRELGIFDETFFLYFEETDLCQRLNREGWKIRYLVESRVAHIGSASTGMKKWTRIPKYWLNSRRYYFTKNHGALYFWLATLMKLLGHSLYKLRCMLTGKSNHEPQKFGRDLLSHALKGKV